MTDLRRDPKVPKHRHNPAGAFVGDVLQNDRSTHGADHPASAATLSSNASAEDSVMNDVPPDTLSAPSTSSGQAPSRLSQAAAPGEGSGTGAPASGMIRFSCSTCGEKLTVPEKYAGRKGACPSCGSINRVPGGLVA